MLHLKRDSYQTLSSIHVVCCAKNLKKKQIRQRIDIPAEIM